MHGGKITVATAPGAGSTFSFTLPATTVEAPRGPSGAPAPARLIRAGGRVLVVEDEPEVAGTIRRDLERAGYEVLVARTAADARDVTEVERPDLLILDVLLPDMSGLTLLEQLRGNPSTARVPVVLISILYAAGQAERVGAIDYLGKSASEGVLLARVRAILGHSRKGAVLVADEHAEERSLVAGHLRRAGYRVLEAADGGNAVALARRERPSLVLMDCQMATPEGVATLRTLRSEEATRDVPVIMTTDAPSLLEGSRSAVEALGAAALLTQACTAEELAGLIARGLAHGAVK
jgi:DNA-binding response OmpR family regulator